MTTLKDFVEAIKFCSEFLKENPAYHQAMAELYVHNVIREHQRRKYEENIIHPDLPDPGGSNPGADTGCDQHHGSEHP